jgi:transposase
MQLKTILNHVYKHKSFVYAETKLVRGWAGSILEVRVKPRAGSRPICSGCGRAGPGYDTLGDRYFEFVPLWAMAVLFIYAMRRVNCPRCGVKVEKVPWAEGKHQLTTAYAWFLAAWAKHLSWSQAAEIFGTTWHHVYCAVEMAVEWGRAHMSLAGIRAIGVDELAWARGHQYVTVVYQIDEGCRRLLWVGQHRTAKTLLRFFRWLGKKRAARLRFVCSDMWKPYLKVIARKAAGALHILDRFHIMVHLNKAIDKVRAGEARAMKARGLEPALKHSRWCFLKRPENLTGPQAIKLSELLKLNLKTVKSYLMKEEFQLFWEYVSPWWAGVFLDQWCARAMRSRIEPIKGVARMLRGHRELILNWFRARKAFSAGVVEGLNNKAKLTTKKAYGFSSYKTLEVALYHTLGNLPEPEFTHRFF